MINVGTLVKVNKEKAATFTHGSHWLEYKGFGIIVKPPRQWFGTNSGFDMLGGNNIGWNNPSGEVIVEFPQGRVRIPSTWLTVVEGQ